MNPSPIGHYFEEFETGQIIKHQLSKTIFESDNNFFSLLTMNHHPLHTAYSPSWALFSNCPLFSRFYLTGELFS